MEEGPSVYRYALMHAPREIRVLKLEPAASFADPVITSLFVRRINETPYPEHPLPTYHCVSYCWGEVQDWQWMMCDGQRLKISKNVDVMLRYLRKEHSHRNLWVDAICIDQANDAEKAEQVGRMGRIYECAHKVHIWLGPAVPKDNIPSVFAVLRNWALKPRFLLPVDLRKAPPPLLAAMNAFLARPWFTRRWVLQEVKLAHAVTVHCGHYRISWAWIRHVMESLSATSDGEDGTSLILGLMLPSKLGALEGFGALEHSTNPRTTMLDLLWDFHFSLCKDNRDRLFALYSLWARSERSSSHTINLDPYIYCPVTYSSDFVSVYTRLATAAIESGWPQANTLIGHVLAFGSLAQQNPSWPSWVPSWNLARKSREKMTLSPHSNYVSTHPSSGLPKIRMLGSIYPVTTLHHNATPGATLAFFDSFSFDQGNQDVCIPRYNIASTMLFRIMEMSRALYDRADFDFNAVFSRTEKSDKTTFPDDYRDDALIRTLKHTFQNVDTRVMQNIAYSWKALGQENASPDGFRENAVIRALENTFRGLSNTQVMPDLTYSPEALGQEIDRLTHGLALFEYDHHGERVPGVAFDKVEYGDYVFRAHESTHSDIALILRPYAQSIMDDYSVRRRLRIVGYCMDYEAWDRIHRLPQRVWVNIA